MNQNQKEIAKKNIIYSCYRGSIAHGTNTAETDDVDRLHVYVAPVEYYMGFEDFCSFEEKEGADDDVYYEVRHFTKLLAGCNPNLITALWTDVKYRIKETLWSDVLLNNREKFLSQKAYLTFVGYSRDQLSKMDGKGKYLGYMGEKRKELVDQFGYDPKHASHLIRLLTMGIEILEQGYPVVLRPDAQFFIDIKTGKYPLSEIQDLADTLFEKIERVKTTTKLPEIADYKFIERMTIEIIQSFNHLEVIPSHKR